MSLRKNTGTTRRRFLGQAVAAAGVAPLMAGQAESVVRASELGVGAREAVSGPSSHASPSSASSYRTLNLEEAAFTEALVRCLCPADGLTPDGVACGLARQIDRELAGDLAQAARRFAPIAWSYGEVCEPQQSSVDRQYFRAGVAAINDVSERRHGARFADLVPSDGLALLGAIELGQLDHARFPLASWMRVSLKPLVTGAALADPIHERYSNKVLWKVIGSA